MFYLFWIGLFLISGMMAAFVENSLLSLWFYIPLFILLVLIYRGGFAAKIEKGGSNSGRVKISDIDQLTGLEFEKFLYHLFNRQGYQAEVTKDSNDQGADLILVKTKRKFFFKKSSQRIVVQAKRYQDSVGNSAVQQVVAAKGHYDCDQAMVVTNSYFTSSAKELASSNQVELWNRERLQQELKETPIFFANLRFSNNLT
ncbi:restriction endonuclease [Fuchsiella alkaliacetigena]|uniref:restriction endonuclease n=1 Tax=Fuchsiella alkaliacetigena TaxID=957042 RepID=UPI00200AA705|nr:restriction endonuclease [Fuchsiella alkaliacetigena]MCK8825667.1 restriction endonuclease [Fuchsiella alkaliacetigena]